MRHNREHAKAGGRRRKRAVVVGLGATGLSCVRHLRAQGYDVAAVDSRAQPPAAADVRRAFPEVAVTTGAIEHAPLAGADLIAVSPGVSARLPAIRQAAAAGAEVVGDIELFARALRARAKDAGRAPPVIAITGANGKSSVTSLTGAMCRAAGLDTCVAGNIGTPVLDALAQAPAAVYVLELSSFQLETTSSLNARAATVLNITPDHMDRYESLSDYAEQKARIFEGDGVMVLNADDPIVMSMRRRERQVRRFTLGPPENEYDYGVIERDGHAWLAHGERPLMPASELRLPGRHNLANVLAAMALAEVAGVPLAAMREAVRAFRGLPHRTQLVAEKDGVRWIDDSKGTNVGATLAALSGMDAPVVLIAGGDGKGADFTPLRAACARRARAVVLIGRDAHLIEEALAGAVPSERARDMHDAVRRARVLAHRGDVVLLSPACASFDMFKNYEHRGDVFAQAVREIVA